MSSIPSVSLQSLASNDSEVITDLENNLENIGFFILKDHGLNLNLVRDAFSLSKDLFNLNIIDCSSAFRWKKNT